MKTKLRWLMLVVPVLATVAVSCAPAGQAPDPQAVGAGLFALTGIISLLSVSATIGQHGGNGAATCILVFCKFLG